jgi:hypothetical protein
VAVHIYRYNPRIWVEDETPHTAQLQYLLILQHCSACWVFSRSHSEGATSTHSLQQPSDQTTNIHNTKNISWRSPTCWLDICAVGSWGGIRFPATFLSHWRQFIGLTDQTHAIEVVPPEGFLTDPELSHLNISSRSVMLLLHYKVQ